MAVETFQWAIAAIKPVNERHWFVPDQFFSRSAASYFSNAPRAKQPQSASALLLGSAIPRASNRSGSLAMFAAMRRASPLVNLLK